MTNCKMCKPYKAELGSGWLYNANQKVACWDCNPDAKEHDQWCSMCYPLPEDWQTECESANYELLQEAI